MVSGNQKFLFSFSTLPLSFLFTVQVGASRGQMLEMAELPAARTRMVAAVPCAAPVPVPVKAVQDGFL